jgi:hypothetical protein
MQLEQGKFCPLIGKDCIGLQCSWFTKVVGVNPQTGQEIDEWECAVKWIPLLVIESSQQTRQAGAAVESFRNEVVKANKQNQNLYRQSLNQVIPSTLNILSSHGE